MVNSMAGIINWDAIIREHGYPDPTALCTDYYKKFGSLEKASNELGISIFSLRKMLEHDGKPRKFICRHCGEWAEMEAKKYRSKTCNKEKCQAAEKERLRKMECQYKANRRHKKRMQEDEPDLKTEYSEDPCPKCGDKMELYNRYRCNACWRGTASGGLDENPHTLRYN